MPHFTLSGSIDGPVITTFVSVSRISREIMLAQGKAVPNSVQVRALIDTGATFTCVDSAVVARLNLVRTGTMSVLTPTTGAIPQLLPQYDVDLQFVSPTSQVLPPLEDVSVLQALLSAQGIQALIGRDILARCLFVFDGPSNSFSLSV